MATTDIPVWTTPATLTAEKVAAIIESLTLAQGDCDKAGDVEDATYYQGLVDAYIEVLNLLHDVQETPYVHHLL